MMSPFGPSKRQIAEAHTEHMINLSELARHRFLHSMMKVYLANPSTPALYRVKLAMERIAR